MASQNLHHNNKTFAVALDIDGVLIQGPKLIPGAKEVLKKLQDEATKIPFVFITNSSIPEPLKVKQLLDLFNLKFEEEQFILAHSPMKSLVDTYKDKLILLVGVNHYSTMIAQMYGFNKYITLDDFAARYPLLYPTKKYPIPTSTEPLDPVEAIFILRSPDDWFESFQIVCDVVQQEGVIHSFNKDEMQSNPHLTSLLSHGPNPNNQHKPQKVKIFLANPDLVYQDKYSVPRFTLGAFAVCIEALYKNLTGSDLEVILYGKPCETTYQFATDVLMKQAKDLGYDGLSTIYAIGDNPKADISGANKAGWVSILTRTGCFAGTENDKEYPATHIAEDVLQAINWILEREEKIHHKVNYE